MGNPSGLKSNEHYEVGIMIPIAIGRHYAVGIT
jgi:hypothetical protein